ncbi:MAG: 2-C-methyl-D-erythritol 2,4-cyclodiphosphate synthase [Planctomycetes bacterium]|nr:2-C-methyl-D-erythritol 2,4-cyclodiphosphate synthase [Planctomycetota bacterium]NOG56023.1 2-C-methyl-D-erythritol 2,4-cyclodiphosphate synthase [Planctomycetota bacterium]
MAENGHSEPLPYRIGHGFDLHRLEPVPADAPSGAGLVVCGVRMSTDVTAVGHSDGDAVYHAVTDAILGAIAEPDIGQLFPDTSPKWKGADSSIFVTEAVARAGAAGYGLGNIDVTVVLERPRLSTHKDRMRTNLAALLRVGADRVNLKGKTHESVDAIGTGQAIAVHAVVLMIRRNT